MALGVTFSNSSIKAITFFLLQNGPAEMRFTTLSRIHELPGSFFTYLNEKAFIVSISHPFLAVPHPLPGSFSSVLFLPSIEPIAQVHLSHAYDLFCCICFVVHTMAHIIVGHLVRFLELRSCDLLPYFFFTKRTLQI
jgi:hypothetical protein